MRPWQGTPAAFSQLTHEVLCVIFIIRGNVKVFSVFGKRFLMLREKDTSRKLSPPYLCTLRRLFADHEQARGHPSGAPWAARVELLWPARAPVSVLAAVPP